MRFTFFLLIWYNLCLSMANCCHSDRNPDHRARVNCTGMTLSTVPSVIDRATEVIVLTDNEFVSLSWTSYQSFLKLHELDLSRNKVASLEKMPDLILPSLRVLRLSGNRLQELPGSAFVAASKLTEIYLRANQLHTLNEDTFKDLENLEVLDLSQNLIHVLPLSLLSVITTKILKTFDVEDNRLKVMPNQFFSKLPDIPYVYLSKNPWVCDCEVRYLTSWLEDQGHNVYVHTGPSNIVNDPESVVCDSPSRLKDQAIIDLTDDAYCSPSGDMDSAPLTTAISTTLSTVYVPPSTQTSAVTQTNTIIPTQMKTTVPTLTQTSTSTQTTTIPIQTNSTTHTFIKTTTPTQTHTTNSAFGFLTATMYFFTWTSWYEYYATESITSKIVAEMGIETKPTTISTTFQMTTIPTPTPTSTFTPPSTTAPLSTTALLSTTAHHPTTINPPCTKKQSLTTGSVVLENRIQERPVVYYCWWLFISYLCLCVLLVLWLCTISLWTLRAYLKVYLPLARKKQEQRRNTLRLLGYHVRQRADTAGKGENVGWRGNVGGRAGAISLPFEGAEGVQATFRSVLFVYKTGERKEGGEEEEECEAVKSEDTGKEDGPTTSQECMIGEGTGRVEIGVGERGELHRKTVYKVISREEEITGWRDMDTSQKVNPNEEAERVVHGWSERSRRSSELNKRYSLILREERVEGEERRESSVGNEWVVGEWLLRDRGGEGVGGDTREEDWWSLMPLIARGSDLEPRRGDSSTATNVISSETHL